MNNRGVRFGTEVSEHVWAQCLCTHFQLHFQTKRKGRTFSVGGRLIYLGALPKNPTFGKLWTISSLKGHSAVHEWVSCTHKKHGHVNKHKTSFSGIMSLRSTIHTSSHRYRPPNHTTAKHAKAGAAWLFVSAECFCNFSLGTREIMTL